ncbi:MAG: hypothetical protein EHM41_11825 [Chloroflexi bacterium]|nr:MAG: hypothetical protein EHM41_11825 [Chloroflexota bacterium]
MSTKSMTGSVTVAPSNASPQVKSRADLICAGIDDQVELRESLIRAGLFTVAVDSTPSSQNNIECYGRHSVVWLPGDYFLNETLTIPAAADVVIQAEGTYLHYDKPEGDVILLTGMNRCRYYFGVIDTRSRGAALKVKPTRKMPALMSIITYMGLIGHDQRGTGILLDTSEENVCTNRFEGMDISGFDMGIYIPSPGSPTTPFRPTAKCDTNWFWVSYIRMCNTCIQEEGDSKYGRIDDNVWYVNVDASIPDSVAIRTAAIHGKWYVIMGTFHFEGKNKALILDPGARYNVIEMHPPIEEFAWENNSGSDTNVILSAKQQPFFRMA